MAQHPKKKQPPQEAVTPPSLVTSILISCPIFALIVLREVVFSHAPQNTMLTMFLYLVFGLILAFFWRRLHAQALKHLCTAAYLVSLWLYMGIQAFAILVSPGLMGMINIAGLVAISGISVLTIIAWMVSEKKNPATLALGSLGFVVLAAFSYQMILGQQAWPVAQSAKKVEIISASDYEVSDRQDDNSQIVATKQASAGESSFEPPAKVEKPRDKLPLAKDRKQIRAEESLAKHTDSTNIIATKPLAKPATWSYQGKTAPHRWAHLSRDFQVCGSGQEQSPIDIPRFWRPSDHLQLSYQPSPYSVIDLGHTLQVNLMRPQEIRIAGQIYKVENMQFRSPSEHLLHGKAYPLEIQISHRNQRGELAILGIMAQLGREHQEIAHILRHIPSQAGTLHKPQEQQLEIQRFIPKDQASYAYIGSLTTPPCREGVKWNIFHEKIEISAAQMQAFRHKYHYNARPPQALNFR